jgi:hypothetical protein
MGVQVVSGEVAALFTQPGQAWEGGGLMQAVGQADVTLGTVIDVASLAAIYDEMPAAAGLRGQAVGAFTEQAMDAPLGMPTRLGWLASAMGVHVVLNLGDEPVLPHAPTGSLWGPYNPATGRSEGGLYGLEQAGFPGIAPHLVENLPAKLTHRPVSFRAHHAASLSVGQAVKVLPLQVAN